MKRAIAWLLLLLLAALLPACGKGAASADAALPTTAKATIGTSATADAILLTPPDQPAAQASAYVQPDAALHSEGTGTTAAGASQSRAAPSFAAGKPGVAYTTAPVPWTPTPSGTTQRTAATHVTGSPTTEKTTLPRYSYSQAGKTGAQPGSTATPGNSGQTSPPPGTGAAPSTRTAATTTTAKPTAAGVSFAIDCAAAVDYGNAYARQYYPNGTVLPAQRMELKSGESVLDLLSRSGVAVESGKSFLGVYVSAIGGLREKACGGGSGWVYEVNGTRPSASSDKYIPKSGDAVVWKYTLSP
jgi:hypothetical protein